MPAPPTTGITNFIQNVNNGISGFQIAYGTNTKATITFNAPPLPPGWVLSSVEVHWFPANSTSETNSGALTPVGGQYSYSITQVANSTIWVQVVLWITPPTGPLPATFASSSNLLQSGGIGTSITEQNMSLGTSTTTAVTIGVVLSGGGGMN
jgi:hypothetical protein